MPIDDLPGQLIIPLKSEIRERYLRDVRIRAPGAVTVEGTKEYVDASVFADQAAALYYNAKNIGDYVANVNKSGPALAAELEAAGLYILPAVGGSGYVQINASIGGGTIYEGDELLHQSSGLRFKCIATALYLPGSYVPIIGIDTGPSTNLSAGSVLQWVAPRPGILQTCVIIEQSDGSGLSGGRNQETDDEAWKRLVSHRAKPPASGNDAEYQSALAKVPGITVQQGYTYSCLFGPGSKGIAFTLRPGIPGGNRIPNSTQIAIAHAYLRGRFPADDQLYMHTIVEVPTVLIFDVSWASGAADWADAVPWPKRSGTNIPLVDAAVTATATNCRLTTVSAIDPPQVGDSIAFYDANNGRFRQKRIVSFTEVVTGKSWDLNFDLTNAASDVDYVPSVGEGACPWSVSLATLVSPITAYFDTAGPGEVVDPIPDPGLRQKRSPRSPALYPSAVTNRLLNPLFDLPSVFDIELISPDVPYETPVGVPGVYANVLALGSILAFPQT